MGANRNIFITGATGALGPALLAELIRGGVAGRIDVLVRIADAPLDVRRRALVDAVVRADERLTVTAASVIHLVAGDVRADRLGMTATDATRLADDVDVIIHAAADIRFRADLESLRLTNVAGTRNALHLAATLPRLSQFILVSTACVAGTRTGTIDEQAPGDEPPDFVNAYEQSKWEAERVALASGLPVRIARLSTIVGSERTGEWGRAGAIHHALGWFSRGLISLVPGAPDTRVDLISVELAARFLAKAVAEDVGHPTAWHVAAGDRAPRFGDLLALIVGLFRELSPAWRSGAIREPVMVDRRSYELFRDAIERSGDAVLGQVLASASSFLPALLHPKCYDTTNAQSLWGGPLPVGDWRATLTWVVRQGFATNWGRAPARGAA